MMVMIQMMIRMMGMPIVTVPNGGHSDSLVIHQPALTVPLRPCHHIQHLAKLTKMHHIQHLAKMAKLTKMHHIQYLATIPTKNGQMAKYALKIPLRPAHHFLRSV